jgi:hypothetical protein
MGTRQTFSKQNISAKHLLANPNRIPPFIPITPVPHTRRRPHQHTALGPPDDARRPPVAAARRLDANCWRCILVHQACSLHFGLDLIMELIGH